MLSAVVFISLIALASGLDFELTLEEECIQALKELKAKPTFRTLYDTIYYSKYLLDDSDRYTLTMAISDYKSLTRDCCQLKRVNETCPTEEHEKHFLKDHEREIKIFEDRTGEEIEVQMPDLYPEEVCDVQLKELKKNPTVRTLYKYINLHHPYEGELDYDHLMSSERDYKELLDECCKTEGVKETFPTKEHEMKFLQDVEQELKKFKRENPSVKLYKR
uniref:Uncharacterized protein n=1 Tax=Romanomermis culicivorax TaxID=13658 RepID=A0A915HNY0_ROMCU